ncbi:hypothetical protein ACWU37_20890 (plasmid) [Photobacterium damselae subsp. damselae]|uniref:hypothetical protein n=1 Tax=Photobacterium damselae TaxID=38293 RepID=UPI001F177125|nr:hypothetical protein [Photobacterium damselae]UKA12844.1 hypothetical protein IHC91_20860 [Photobacterium damselae subsp. damselae]
MGKLFDEIDLVDDLDTLEVQYTSVHPDLVEIAFHHCLTKMPPSFMVEKNYKNNCEKLRETIRTYYGFE